MQTHEEVLAEFKVMAEINLPKDCQTNNTFINRGQYSFKQLVRILTKLRSIRNI